MKVIERNVMQQIGGGSMTLLEWLGQVFTSGHDDEPDRWIYEELNHNAQY